MDINSNNGEALIDASGLGNYEIVKYLVEHGADVHANNNRAYRDALEYGYVAVAGYLRSKI